jgi:protein-S-isoprenylcysteine O-methyltransferase Ste14
LGATLYFTLGSLLEERRLEVTFGQAYRDYRQRVPWLIPFARSRGLSNAG